MYRKLILCSISSFVKLMWEYWIKGGDEIGEEK